ncbi:helix-turn-helix domain-containing protein [Pyrobaculum sp.]|uniref:ArsR/SmtB family transcription factor n=1 Tax=Pyrobaculum sp. TaxID=2004705 RepID=UPI00315E2FD9
MEFKAEYYAVLELLAKGPRTVGELASELGMPEHDVASILSALEGYGLVERREKGFLVKREAYALSGKGWEALAQWRREVERRVDEAYRLKKEGRDEEAAEVLDPIAPVLPLLLSLGLIDLAMWTALFGEEVSDFADDVEFDVSSEF